MTADNFDQVFQALRGRQPFQVFTVELNGGRRFEIEPQQVALVGQHQRNSSWIKPTLNAVRGGADQRSRWRGRTPAVRA